MSLSEDPTQTVRFLVLPAITLGTAVAAGIARMTRSSMLEVLSLDYIRTGEAKGVGRRAILYKHSLRNAIIPVMATIALSFSGLLGGAAVTETVFTIPGLGSWMVDSVARRDFVVLEALLLAVRLHQPGGAPAHRPVVPADRPAGPVQLDRNRTAPWTTQTLQSSRYAARRRSLRQRIWRNLTRNVLASISLLVLVLIILSAVFAPLLTDKDPNRLNVRSAFAPPGSEGHLLGTDDLGRDLYSRLLYGGRVSLLIAGTSALGAGIFGMIIGLSAGYLRRIDTLLMLFMDGLMAFPSILLALVVVAVLGRSQLNVVMALVIVFGPRISRIVRSSVLVLRELAYVEAAQSLGVPTWRIMLRHLLPNALAPWLVLAPA